MSRARRRRTHPGIITFAVICVSVAGLYVARDVVIPIVFSVLLAFLLARPVTWLERRKFGRISAVMVVVTVAFTLIGVVSYVVGEQVVSLAANLDRYQGEISRKVGSLRGTGSGLGRFLERVNDQIVNAGDRPTSQPAVSGTQTVPAPATAPAALGGSPLPVVTGPPGTSPSNPLYTAPQAERQSSAQTVLSYVSVVAGPLGTAGLVVVFVVFMLLEREPLRDRLIMVVSQGNYTVTTRAINDATDRISRYLLAQSIVNGTYGLTIGLGLFVISLILGHGVWFPSFVLWGLLCAVLRFIPYVGPAVSSLFPVALALAVYPGFSVAVAVISLFVVVELISNNVMEPWLYGASTGLSTVAILIAAVFWTWLWGSAGLLVATPLTVCLAVAGKYVRPLRFLHTLLSDEDPLPPSVNVYQRLLAGDRVDAERIVDRVARLPSELPPSERPAIEQSPEDAPLADSVFLPVLKMARRDRADGRLSVEAENRVFDETLAIARRHAAGEPPPAAPSGTAAVVAYPAHHRSSEIALNLLADELSGKGIPTTVLSTRVIAADVEAAVDRDRPAALVIGVMPPGGLPQARYLCRRFRKRYPQLPICVGYWGKPRDFDRLLVRFRKAGATYVFTSVGQTRARIAALVAADQRADQTAAGITPIESENEASR